MPKWEEPLAYALQTIEFYWDKDKREWYGGTAINGSYRSFTGDSMSSVEAQVRMWAVAQLTDLLEYYGDAPWSDDMECHLLEQFDIAAYGPNDEVPKRDVKFALIPMRYAGKADG